MKIPNVCVCRIPSGRSLRERGSSAHRAHPRLGLVMVGGQGPEYYYNSVEHTLDGETFTALPNLPIYSMYGCLVTVGTADQSMITMTGYSSKKRKEGLIAIIEVRYLLNVASFRFTVIIRRTPTPPGKSFPTCWKPASTLPAALLRTRRLAEST